MKQLPLLCLFLTSLAVALPKADLARWQQDLDTYANTLRHAHIDPFHSLSEQAFDSELNTIRAQLPSLTESELIVRLMRLTHSINDGHTSFPLWGKQLHQFPVQLKIINKAVYVVKTSNKYRHLLGAKLISINYQAIDQIVDAVSLITPFSENPFSTSTRAAQYLTKAEVLEGLGIIDHYASARFKFTINGKSSAIRMQSSLDSSLTEQLPLSFGSHIQPDKRLNQNLWFGSSNNKKTVYFQFRRYPSRSQMENIAKHLLGFINKHQSEQLIIDLRDNYGGDFFVGLILAQYLVLADSIDWKSGVYVLIDNVTFSAAMSNAAQFSQILNAKLVGEPTGARPSGYQDMGQFTLPNSKLEVSYSKRLYHFKEDKRDALYPDVDVSLTIDDYIHNTDPQLSWILNDISTAQ